MGKNKTSMDNAKTRTPLELLGSLRVSCRDCGIVVGWAKPTGYYHHFICPQCKAVAKVGLSITPVELAEITAPLPLADPASPTCHELPGDGRRGRRRG